MRRNSGIPELPELPGDAFRTIEEPLHLTQAINEAAQPDGVILIDCLTVWLGNLMYYLAVDTANCGPIEDLIRVLAAPPCDIILVTNEVGNGIVPTASLARHYRDIAGRLNQRVAAIADEVTLLVCGVPLRVKFQPPGEHAPGDAGSIP